MFFLFRKEIAHHNMRWARVLGGDPRSDALGRLPGRPNVGQVGAIPCLPRYLV